MNIHLQISDKFMENLIATLSVKQLGTPTPQKVVQEALALLQFSANETNQGRYICSCNADGSEVFKINLPSLKVL